MKRNLEFNCPNRYQCVLWIAMILSFVIFRHVYVDILNQFIVQPILSGVNDNDLLTSIGVLITWIIVFDYYLHRYRKERTLNIIRVINVVTIAVVYLLYRIEGPWNFYRFSFLPAIAYTDILLVPFLAENLKWIISLFAKTPPGKNERSFPFISDTATSEDDYNRGPLADQLIQRLNDTFSSYREQEPRNNNIGAFAVGICGPWGSGKTSFLNLLKNQIKEQKKQGHEMIYFEYKPWLCFNEKDILTEFFSSIKKHLSPYNRSISGQTEDYLNKLIQVDTSGLSRSIQLTTRLFKDSQTVFSEYKKLKESIRKINQPIFIFLDDLDRLNEEEIFETLKIVRNTANFQNLFFILAYDKEHLLETMSRMHSNPEAYLEKIINTEIVFPAFEDAVIINELKRQLKTAWLILFGEAKHIKRWEEIESVIFSNPDLLPKYFKNFRDVNRFIDSFSTSAFVIREKIIEYNEIYWPDIFLLEILKVKYQNVYNILKDNPTSILLGKKNYYSIDEERFKKQINLLKRYNPSDRLAQDLARQKNAAERSRKESIWEKGKNPPPTTKENTNDQSSSTALSENNDFILSIIEADKMKKSEGCYILLSSIFSDGSDMNQVAHIQSFYKYFSYRLKTGEISLNEFVAIIHREDQLEQKLNDLIENNTDNLRPKFHLIIQKHAEYDFAKILHAVLIYFKLLGAKYPRITEKPFYLHINNWYYLFRTDQDKQQSNSRDERNRITILTQFKDVDYNSVQWRLLTELLKIYETGDDIDKLVLSVDDITYLIGSIVLSKKDSRYSMNEQFLEENPSTSTGIFRLFSHYTEKSFAYKFLRYIEYSKEKASVSIEEDVTKFLKAYEDYSEKILESIPLESSHSGEQS